MSCGSGSKRLTLGMSIIFVTPCDLENKQCGGGGARGGDPFLQGLASALQDRRPAPPAGVGVETQS